MYEYRYNSAIDFLYCTGCGSDSFLHTRFEFVHPIDPINKNSTPFANRVSYVTGTYGAVTPRTRMCDTQPRDANPTTPLTSPNQAAD